MVAFLWGQGGQRLTPEQIAATQQNALQRSSMASSTAPIGHWTQGLNQVLNGLIAGGDLASARKADAANRAESNAVMQALMGGGAVQQATPVVGATSASSSPAAPDQVTLMQAMNNPYISDAARQMAQQQYQQLYAPQKPMEIAGKLVNPRTGQVIGDYSQDPEIIRLSRIANDPNQPSYIRQDAAARIQALNDPMMTTSLPGGGVYMGPQSMLPQFMGATPPPMQQPQAPAQMPPDRLPPNFNFGGGQGSGPANFPR